jgi:hypothetical protein
MHFFIEGDEEHCLDPELRGFAEHGLALGPPGWAKCDFASRAG